MIRIVHPTEPRVLIIDDDFVSLELLQSTLSPCGYTTYTIPSAIGATRLIERERVGVVILDLNLPHLNGEKVAQMLRRQRRTRDVGLVLVSGRPTEELETIALEVQADRAVPKRQIRSALPAAVSAALARHAERRSMRQSSAWRRDEAAEARKLLTESNRPARASGASERADAESSPGQHGFGEALRAKKTRTTGKGS